MNNLQVVIVEDEAVTARNLARTLQKVQPGITVTATLGTVAEAVEWFGDTGHTYDLIFMDISLADGTSFDIFKSTQVRKPVIFVTAYHEHALQAFKNNGIDYILKPFDEQEISAALLKYADLTGTNQQAPTISPEALIAQLQQLTKPYKRSFLVHFREKLIPVETQKIAWFYTSNELVYAHTTDARQYVMEFTMEQLEQQLDPQAFFRANRQFLINRAAISEVEFFFNGRLLVKVKPDAPAQVLISKARVPEFKTWMNS